MKKALSLVLALAILCSMALMCACTGTTAPAGTDPGAADSGTPAGTPAPTGGETADPPPAEELTEAVLQASLPNEYVPEKLAAGMEVVVASVWQGLTDQLFVLIDENLALIAEEKGYCYSSASMDDDFSKGIQLIENFVQMGAANIVTILPDPSAAIDICRTCEENGCYLSLVGAVPDGYVSCCVNVDQSTIGTQQAELAKAWVDQQYPDAGPGEIKVAFLGNTMNSDPAVRTYATEDALAADPRFDLVYTNHNSRSLDAAFTAVQEAFTMDPGVRLVLTFNSSQAVGCSNYIMSLPNAELSEYAVFCCGYNNETLELIEQSKTNDSVLRGTMAFSGAVPWEGYELALFGLLDGRIQPGDVYWERIWAIDEVGFVYDSQA